MKINSPRAEAFSAALHHVFGSWQAVHDASTYDPVTGTSTVQMTAEQRQAVDKLYREICAYRKIKL